MMDDALEPCGAPGSPRRDAIGERFAEDPPWAGNGGAAEPTDLDLQTDSSAVRGKVHEVPVISAMDSPRPPTTLGASGVTCCWTGEDQQPVGFGGHRRNEKPSGRHRLE